MDFVSDEGGKHEIDEQIQGLAYRTVFNSESGFVRPVTFRGKAGTNIFRDEIFANLKIVFKADHREYKKTGIYDYPHKRPLQMIFSNLIYWITSIGFIKEKMFKDFSKFMVRPYKHLFADQKAK